MAGPAAAGVLIYAKDLNRLAQFYAQVLAMREVHREAALVVLESSALQLVIHAIPAEIAAHIQISTPPQRRADAAIKFFVTVASMSTAGQQAAALGGQVFDERWQGPDFALCNAMDCEGNVFQLRETLEAVH